MNYSFSKVKEKVNTAIQIFLKNDLELLEINVNERSISHKMAEYLQSLFPEWHVDCEYNRMKNHEMSEDYITKTLNLPIEDLKSNDTEAKTVFPDIIIHNRRNTDDNLLAIEIKKSLNSSDEARKHDFNKLKAFKYQLNYKYCLFLLFFVKDKSHIKPKLEWPKEEKGSEKIVE